MCRLRRGEHGRLCQGPQACKAPRGRIFAFSASARVWTPSASCPARQVPCAAALPYCKAKPAQTQKMQMNDEQKYPPRVLSWAQTARPLPTKVRHTGLKNVLCEIDCGQEDTGKNLKHIFPNKTSRMPASKKMSQTAGAPGSKVFQS